MHNIQRCHRLLGGLVGGLIGLLALGPLGTASAGELLIEQRLSADGALLVRYTPPEGVRELALFDRSGTMATVWGEMARPLEACASVTLEPRVRIQLAEGCAAATFRIAPRLLGRSATYEPAFAVGGTAVMSYSGYYAVALPGRALRWRWLPGTGEMAVVSGRMAQQPVDRLISAAQVDFAARDEGRTQAGWAALAANEYSLVGRAETEAVPGGTLIHDGRLDAARLDAVRSMLRSATDRLARAYRVAPATPWAVVASTSAQVRGFWGDVTAGRMMSLRFNPAAPEAGAARDQALRQTRRFVAHEVTHWWDTGVFRTDHQHPWIHEGHADWMAGLLMHEAGHTDSASWRAEIDVALSNCQLVRRDRPAAALPTGFHRDDDPYACGQVIWLLAQSAHSREAAPLDIGASLFRDSTVPIDAAAVARWADGASSGPMHRLLFDPQLGFTTALQRDWQAIVESRPLQAGEALPQPLHGRLGTALMVALMAADCGGVSLWTQADHFRLEPLPGCRTLRGERQVRRIAGISPFADPVGAWQAMRSACAAGGPIALDAGTAEVTALACPSPLPEMPVHTLLRLRPQALQRLGLEPASPH